MPYKKRWADYFIRLSPETTAGIERLLQDYKQQLLSDDHAGRPFITKRAYALCNAIMTESMANGKFLGGLLSSLNLCNMWALIRAHKIRIQYDAVDVCGTASALLLRYVLDQLIIDTDRFFLLAPINNIPISSTLATTVYKLLKLVRVRSTGYNKVLGIKRTHIMKTGSEVINKILSLDSEEKVDSRLKAYFKWIFSYVNVDEMFKPMKSDKTGEITENIDELSILKHGLPRSIYRSHASYRGFISQVVPSCLLEKTGNKKKHEKLIDSLSEDSDIYMDCINTRKSLPRSILENLEDDKPLKSTVKKMSFASNPCKKKDKNIQPVTKIKDNKAIKSKSSETDTAESDDCKLPKYKVSENKNSISRFTKCSDSESSSASDNSSDSDSSDSSDSDSEDSDSESSSTSLDKSSSDDTNTTKGIKKNLVKKSLNQKINPDDKNENPIVKHTVKHCKGVNDVLEKQIKPATINKPTDVKSICVATTDKQTNSRKRSCDSINDKRRQPVNVQTVNSATLSSCESSDEKVPQKSVNKHKSNTQNQSITLTDKLNKRKKHEIEDCVEDKSKKVSVQTLTALKNHLTQNKKQGENCKGKISENTLAALTNHLNKRKKQTECTGVENSGDIYVPTSKNVTSTDYMEYIPTPIVKTNAPIDAHSDVNSKMETSMPSHHKSIRHTNKVLSDAHRLQKPSQNEKIQRIGTEKACKQHDVHGKDNKAMSGICSSKHQGMFVSSPDNVFKKPRPIHPPGSVWAKKTNTPTNNRMKDVARNDSQETKDVSCNLDEINEAIRKITDDLKSVEAEQRSIECMKQFKNDNRRHSFTEELEYMDSELSNIPTSDLLEPMDIPPISLLDTHGISTDLSFYDNTQDMFSS